MMNRKYSHTAVENMLAQTLQRTKIRFIDDLDQKISEVESIKILLLNETERQNALTRLAFITHRFSGIAETLGFKDIGDCAAQIEQYIFNFNQTPTQLRTISDRVEILLYLMEDAVVEPL